jgi:hypothetical protein
MSLQPGNGYNFVSSDQGTSLDINKDWTPPIGNELLMGVAFPKFLPFPDINGPGLADPVWPDTQKPLQFEVQTVVVGNIQYVRIAKGAVNFTVSNMPEIYKGVTHDVRQAWITRVAVRPGISSVDGGDSSSPWMENGGYYSMPSSGTYYVTISKMDIGDASSSTLLQESVPFVSVFSESSDLYDKIFSETGPSQYLNQTNVEKMVGYDATSTGLPGDFGNCHTTWFLPVKWGYACKIIAVIQATTPTITAPSIQVLHAATATSNEVHRLTLPPVDQLKKAGSLKLQYAPGFFNSTQTDPFDPFNPLNSGNLSGQFQWNLANALKGISDLRGKSSVTVSGENKLDITYMGELANTAVPLPSIVSNSIGAPTTVYEVSQHVVGSIDLTSHPQFIGTTLMNVTGWVQSADDPYNAYASNSWNDISNYLQKDGLESISAATLDYYDLMLSPSDWTSHNYSWAIPGTCIPEPPPFECSPFRVHSVGTVYEMCPGTVNNVTPSNIDDTLEIGDGDFVWLRCTNSSTAYPSAVLVGSGDTLPADTDTYGYIKIAEIVDGDVVQYVTGSLWSDRIKVAGSTARYYFARV